MPLLSSSSFISMRPLMTQLHWEASVKKKKKTQIASLPAPSKKLNHFFWQEHIPGRLLEHERCNSTVLQSSRQRIKQLNNFRCNNLPELWIIFETQGCFQSNCPLIHQIHSLETFFSVHCISVGYNAWTSSYVLRESRLNTVSLHI